MDLNDIRSWMTVFQMAVFIGIVWWAYSKGNKKRFEEDAKIPFDEDDTPAKQGDKQ